jgi:quinol monooxygenase YgiN
MTNLTRGLAGAVALALLTFIPFRSVLANEMQAKVVRLAKLQIDATQLETYKAALKEEIETSVRVERGVVGLYAVSDKQNPTQTTLLELYADEAAYQSHLETPHFKKYKAGTKDMVQSLQLIETEPILLGSKAK